MSTESDSLGSERLRRAIERNRTKRAGRTLPSGQNRRSTFGSALDELPQAGERRANKGLFGRLARGNRGHQSSAGDSPASRLRPPERHRTLTRHPIVSETSSADSLSSINPSTRNSLGQRRNAPFSRELPFEKNSLGRPERPHHSPTSSHPIRETAPATPSKTPSPFLAHLWDYLLKGAWIFCVILIFRLIFTVGGVVDFYTKRDHFRMKERDYSAIKRENKEIVTEIDLITNSPSHQKKLVRGHLEFISPDEFLILFAKEKGAGAL